MRQHAAKTHHLIHTLIYLHRGKRHFLVYPHDRCVLSVVTLVHKNSTAINAEQIWDQTASGWPGMRDVMSERVEHTSF